MELANLRILLLLMTGYCTSRVCGQGQNPAFTLGVYMLETNTFSTDLMNDLNKYMNCVTQELPQSSHHLHHDLIYQEVDEKTPMGVLQTICDKMMGKNYSTLFLIAQGDDIPIYKYVVNMMSSLGIPIIVWNTKDVSNPVYHRVLHLSPTLYQQAQAYMTLLKYYKWQKFSILTTTCAGSTEFISALRELVRHPDNREMSILSVNQVKDATDNSSITSALARLKKSDTRVILIHMNSDEVQDVMRFATSLNMATEEFVWLGTANIVGTDSFQADQLPLGMIGLESPTLANSDLTSIIYSVTEFWKDSIIRYMKTPGWTPSSAGINSCASSGKAWTGGRRLFEQMLNHTYPEKKIQNCNSKAGVSYKDTTGFEFGQDGTNKFTNMKFVNLAKKKIEGRKSNEQEWREMGSWSAPNYIQLDDITWPGNSPKPPDGVPARSFIRIVTHEEPPYVKFTDPDSDGKCAALGSVLVRLTNVTADSCDGQCGNASLFQCATGLCIDLLTKLKEDLNFDFEMFQARDNAWGNFEAEKITGKKQWNGLVKDLLDGVADISMTSLKIGPERNEAIDFSVPFIETGITIIVYIKQGVISATAFLEPYDLWSWLCVLLVSVHIVGFFMLLFDYASPYGRERYKRRTGQRFSLARSLWLIWTILFGAAVETDNTKGIGSRFLATVWSLFSLVFLASYTANLAAFMITKEEFYHLEGIHDKKLKNPFFEKPPFRFATVPDGSTAINLEKNHPEMYRYMSRHSKKTVKQGIEAVKTDELQAFIYDATVLEYEASRDEDCKLTTVGTWYAMTGYGVGFQKGSKWKKKFDLQLTKYISEGVMDRLRKFWMMGACKKTSSGKGRESSHTLDIINFTSAYILLIVGIGLAVLLILLEHVYFTFFRRKLRKVDKWGCCSLISLSMGESLSFEESVMEVIESTMNPSCTNEFCRAQIHRLNHDLNTAICRLQMLHASLEQPSSERIRRMNSITSSMGEDKSTPKIWNKSISFQQDGNLTQRKPANADRNQPAALSPHERLDSVETCL